jgi:iron complex outermembrane receptor protein
MNNRNEKNMNSRFLLSALAVAIGGLTGGVNAQEQIEEIVTTGSFIQRPADRPQPVVVLGQQDIQGAQRVSLGELMRDMPQVTAVNTNGTNGGVLRSATGSNSINIRGLGDRSTLVLLNGQRQTIDGNAASVVDINSLTPTIMVQQLEMVLDGSSALYGSDAVAAVVNFITRDTFDGAEFIVSTQHAEAQMDAPEMLVSGLLGTQGEKSGLVMGFEYTQREQDLLVSDRYSPEILTLLGGTGSAQGNPGSYTGVSNGRSYPDPLCGSPLVGGDPSLGSNNPAGFVVGGTCRELLTTYRTIEPRSERLTGLSVGTLEFDNAYVNGLRVEAGFSRDERMRAFSTGSPVSSLDSIGATIPATHPGIIDANQRNPDFPIQDYRLQYRSPYSPIEGPVEQGNVQFTYRVASTLSGDFGEDNGWDWKLNGAYSANNTESNNPETIAQRLNLALNGYGGPDCDFNAVLGAQNDPNVEAGVGSCMYYNPFASRLIANPGDPTYSDPEVQKWFTAYEHEVGQAALWTAEAIVTGELFDLPGGTTGVAFGGQLRRQTLDINVDPISAEGGFGSDPQPLKSWNAKRDTSALFAEIALYPTDDLELDLAARWEKTDELGSTEPKVSLLYTPTDDLFIRASWGTSFRVPSEVAVYGVTGEGNRGTTEIGGESQQAEGYTVGNLDLKPETSENFTFGLTWDATDELTVGATYWSYKFTDLITRTSANEFLDLDMLDGFLTDTLHHPLFPGAPNEICEITGRWDPNSGAPRPADCMSALDIRVFNSFWVNQDRMDTSGVDFDIDYQTQWLGYDLRTRLAGSYVLTLEGPDAVTGELRDGAGTDGYNIIGIGGSQNRQLRATLTQEVRRGPHSVRLTGRYTDGYEVKNPNANPLSSNASTTVWDLNYTVDLPFKIDSTFTLAVINLGDRYPPMSPGSLPFSAGLYDARGRMYKLGVNFSF